MTPPLADPRTLALGSVDIRLFDLGPQSGEPVLLIHGWPDTAQLWRHLAPELVGRGYRVLAPDQRGFGGSTKPEAVDEYRVSKSAEDMIGVLDEAGAERAHVVGHDYGAAVAWSIALRQPERVRSLTVLSVGHPVSFTKAGIRQLRRSWYMLLFQFEGVAEEFLSADDWANFRRLMGNHPETENWIAHLSEPGALTASLNWYRANAHPRRLIGPPLRLPPCRVPTLGVWSSEDFALTEEQMTGSADLVEAEWRYERIEDASHWIPLDVPDRLNRLLGEWMGAH